MKRIVFGIDLSFNSTGITTACWDDGRCTDMAFHRLVFDKVPDPIRNINQQTYRMPSNVDVTDLIQTVGEDDFYSEDQAHITLKAMVCVKRIMQIVFEQLVRCGCPVTASGEQWGFGPYDIQFNIEGFVMPSMAGQMQLRVLGGLIMLQGMLRSELIKLKITLNGRASLRITITSPSELKLFFSGYGDADKQEMLDAFLVTFGGAALLPDTMSLAKVNDVVDSFALMLNCHWRLHTTQERRMTTSQKKKEVRLEAAMANDAKKKKKKKQPAKLNIPIIII
jgi:hypothetical protein